MSDAGKLTHLHLRMEDLLIEWRDARLSVLNANGLVVKEKDGTGSSIIRIGTREAIRLILQWSEEYDAGWRDPRISEATTGETK